MSSQTLAQTSSPIQIFSSKCRFFSHFRANPPRQKGTHSFSLQISSNQLTIPDSLVCQEKILTQQISSSPQFKDIGCTFETTQKYSFESSLYSQKLMHLRLKSLKNPGSSNLANIVFSLRINYQYDYFILVDRANLNFQLTSLKPNSFSLSYVTNKRGSLDIALQSLTAISSPLSLSFTEGTPAATPQNKISINGQDRTADFTIAMKGSILQISPSSTVSSGTIIGMAFSNQYFGVISPERFEASICVESSCTRLIWQNFQTSVKIENPSASAETTYTLSLASMSLSGKQLQLLFPPSMDISAVQCSPYPCLEMGNSTLKIANVGTSNFQHQITFSQVKNPNTLELISLTLRIFSGSSLILQKTFPPLTMASHIESYFCQTSCDSCVGSTSECTTCRSPSQAPFFLDFECLNDCPSRHTGSTQNCQKCDSHCQKCSFSGSNVKYCLQCESGYSLSYGQCVPLCQSSLTEASVCLAPATSQCFAQNCENCEYGSSSRCGKCSQGYYRFLEGVCLFEECPRGFYPDEDLKVCLPCHSNCADCNSLSNCLQCSPFFLLRQTVGGQCIGQTQAITVFESPRSSLPHLILSLIGFTQQMAFLQDLSSFALSHSFYKYSDIDQLHRILELLLPLLPNSSQSLDRFAITFQTVLSRVEVIQLDIKPKVEGLFQSSLSQLHSLSLNSPQQSYFSLLKAISSFDRTVTLSLQDITPYPRQYSGSAVNVIQPNSTIQVSLTAYALHHSPSQNLKILNQGTEIISTLSRLVVLQETAMLFQNNHNDKLMSYFGVSIRSSVPDHTQTEYTFNIKDIPADYPHSRCITLDPSLRQLRHIPSCSTTQIASQIKCTCSGDFSLLVVGISFNAISPQQLKSMFTQNQTTYAGITVTAEQKLKVIVNTLELNSLSQSDRQFFLQHFIIQIKEVSDKMQIKVSIERIIDNLLSRNDVSDSQIFWIVKAIVQYSSTPSSSSSLLKKLKSLAQTIPSDGVGIGTLSIIEVPLNGERRELDKVDVYAPSALTKSYPQSARMVVTHFKSTSLFQNTLDFRKFQMLTPPVQLQLLDSLNREIQVNGLNLPIVIEFQLDSHPSSFQRKCVWWDGQDNSPVLTEGCTSSYSGNTLRCECTHLTYFFAALDSEEFITSTSSVFSLDIHLQGLCISGGLLIFGFLIAIIAQCIDQRDKEQAQLMGDPRRNWTNPLVWFFPCLIYKRATPQRKKKGKGKQEAEYHSPKHRSSPSRDKKPSLFSFETQHTTEQEARQHLYPYSARKNSFCSILCYGFIATNALISPFYAFDPYASRAGRSSILFIKLLLSLAISLALLHFLGVSLIVLVSAVASLTLLFTPFSFYGSCYLKRPRKGRAEQYQADQNLQDILPSVQDNRQRDPGFANAFEQESNHSIRKPRPMLPLQIKCTMLTLLSICLGLVIVFTLGFIALFFHDNANDYQLWVGMNLAAIVGGTILGFFKTICAAAVLKKKSDSGCWKCCKAMWVVSHVERVSLNMKREN